MLKISFICSLVCMLAASCTTVSVSKEAPRWVYAPDAVYPAQSFLNAVGEGMSRSDAESRALALLAQTISQSVQAQSESNERFLRNDNTQSYGQSYSGRVVTSSLINEVAGAAIKEVWRDTEGRFYALAQIEREKSGRFYKNKMDANTKAITEALLFADDHWGSLSAYAALQRASYLALENEDYLRLLAVIHEGLYAITDLPYGSRAALDTLIARAKTGLTLAVHTDGDPEGRLAASLAAAAARAGFSVVEEGTPSRYDLEAELDIVPADVGGPYEYVRYTLTVALKDVETGEDLLPFSTNGREAHVTESEAAFRAYRSAAEAVEGEYAASLSALLSQ